VYEKGGKKMNWKVGDPAILVTAGDEMLNEHLAGMVVEITEIPSSDGEHELAVSLPCKMLAEDDDGHQMLDQVVNTYFKYIRPLPDFGADVTTEIEETIER